MPSAQDFLDGINHVKDNTADIRSRLDDVKVKLDQVNANLQTEQQLLLWGFQQLITLGQYTNQALFQNDQQNDAIICILQQISVNTCGIWNEAHTQTPLQESIKEAIRKLSCLYAATHGDAAVTLEREAKLRQQIEACCPPEPTPPACVERPCLAPKPLDQKPPRTDPPPKVEGKIK
jgi:hypothetical protein